MRMAFDEVNAKGGVNGRKIRFIVEDMEYTVLTTDTDFNGPWPNRETPTAISSC
jgi:Periplasmic binding protein